MQAKGQPVNLILLSHTFLNTQNNEMEIKQQLLKLPSYMDFIFIKHPKK